MNSPNGYPQSSESDGVLEGMLRQHTAEHFRTGVYQSWVETVDRYYGGENSNEQSKLSAFALSEMALGATVWREIDNRYPGVHAYFLVKVDIKTGERVKYGEFGTEPIIVANVDSDGNIVERPNFPRPDIYTDEQVQVVVRQAHELEAAGFELNPRPQTGVDPASRGRSVSW